MNPENATRDCLNKLVDKTDLTAEETRLVIRAIMSGELSDAQIAGFLVALRMKGETPTKIAEMAKVMREFAAAISPKVSGTLVDTCGTGGDRKGTINVSTAAMFVAAGAGVPIAKHGNRSVSSKCGSADILEELGVKIDLPPKKTEECIEKVGIGFMFAPVFHTAMKHVMPARKQLGIRTVFNVLGPLTNPANAKGQIMGVFDGALTEKLAEVLKRVGVERAYVVHGVDGLDEISLTGETKISELWGGTIRTYNVKPKDFGLPTARLEDIKGGDSNENARILKDILGGKERGAKRDIVALNAAAAIACGGLAKDIKEGIPIAEKVIDSGKALKKLEDLIQYSQKLAK